MEDVAKLKSAVEKLATLVEAEAAIPGQTMADCMLASIAISMKRLADSWGASKPSSDDINF